MIPRITAVSYLNTLPFVYGINRQLAGKVQLSLDVPSACARRILQREVDFGLAPVGIYPMIADDYTLLPYCIGAVGAVSTVILFSQVPLHEIREIHLDADSRTSVLLIRILAQHYWNISPQWKDLAVIENVKHAESLLAIGDKAFSLKNEFTYQYDLGLEWKNFTGFPFVFAVWVAGKGIPADVKETVAGALEYGITHIQPAIDQCKDERYRGIDLSHYLNRDIHFRMDASFESGMRSYLEYIRKIEPAGLP